MPKFLDVTDTAAARAALGVSSAYVSALDFGAVGDGTTDDTEALQEWLTHVVTNSKRGWLPNGTYKITDTLVAAGANYGWSIIGESQPNAIIKQFTDNIPVLQAGTTAGSSHSIRLESLTLTYNIPQPSTNTNANCLVFDGSTSGDLSSLYWSSFKFLQFLNGYYGMKVASGRFAPWGCEWDMLHMKDMSGGMYDCSASATSGCPNNRWGRMTLFCAGAEGPIFRAIRGYNMVIGTLEFLQCDLGPQLMTLSSGFTADIGSIKMEVGSYTGAGKSMLQFSNPAKVRIGSLQVSGSTAVFTPSSGVLAIVGTSGATVGAPHIEIESILASATSLSGQVVAFQGSGTRFTVGSTDLSGGWGLQYTAGSTTGDFVTVKTYVNNTLSGDKGDADYTVTLGDPNVVQFKTAFTAPRTITLPAQTSRDLCGGLYYDLIFDGAINGSNTAVIKQGSTTLLTQTADKKRLRYMWHRQSTTGQWVLVEVSDLGGDSTGGAARGRYGPRTVIDGDSIVYGSTAQLTSNQTRNSWPAELARLSNGKIDFIYNAGVGGTGISTRLSNFATKVAAYSPQTVILCNGTNDLAMSVSDYLNSLTDYYNLVKGIDADLILGGIYPKGASVSTISTFNAALVQWAAERGVPVIPFWELGDPATGAWPSGWSADGTHPDSNTAAFAALGSLAWRTLEPLFCEPVAQTARYAGEGIYTDFFTNLTGSTGGAGIASITETTGTLPAGTYEYRVGAGNYFGLTTTTDDDSITLAAPAGVQLSVTGSGTYNRRRVFRKDPGSDTFKYIGEITAAGTQTFTDSGLTATYDWVPGDTSLVPTGLTNGGTAASHTLAYGGPIQTDPSIRGNFLRIANNGNARVHYFAVSGLTAGTAIDVSFKCRGANTATAVEKLYLRFRSGGTANIENTILFSHRLGTDWGLVFKRIVVPPTADNLRFSIEADTASPYMDIAELRIALAT